MKNSRCQRETFPYGIYLYDCNKEIKYSKKGEDRERNIKAFWSILCLIMKIESAFGHPHFLSISGLTCERTFIWKNIFPDIFPQYFHQYFPSIYLQKASLVISLINIQLSFMPFQVVAISTSSFDFPLLFTVSCLSSYI